MKKLFYLLSLVVALAVVIAACQKTTLNDNATATESSLKAGNNCATIPGGTIYTSGGVLITTGFMANGYNYQARIYNGDFGYPGWHLVMKWNDAWLSKKDCDHDGLLDRPLDENGNQYYFGSGAWCTNHWTTTYTLNGNQCEYDEFIKIIAVPEGAYTGPPQIVDPWGDTHLTYYTADGDVIGQEIWGQFAIIQIIINDPCAGVEGVQYKSPDHPGLGGW